jgi:DNA-binding MarR family transcriptional regulator
MGGAMTPLDSFDPIVEARRQWSAHWGTGPTASMAAVTSIMRAQQILLARLNLLLKPFELTFPRYEALMILHLSRRGSMPLGKIGERLQVHPTSVTSLIDGLERTAYLSRVPHASDRRATLAEITESGRTAAEAATEVLNRSQFCTTPLKRAELEAINDAILPLRAEVDGFALPAKRRRSKPA